MKKFVSVIIPHLNDSDKLGLCLKSLNNQSYDKRFYEVIVIDNDSSEQHWKKLLRLKSLYKIVLLKESKSGSYAARNKGLQQAKGNIIAFTDSDCIPYPNWIEMGVNNLKILNYHGIVGGKIELTYKNKDHLNAVEQYDMLFAFNQERYINKFNYSVTANLFTSKSILSGIGNFDDSFKSAGDREWGNRAISKGSKIIYGKNVIIKHPAHNTLKGLIKKGLRITGGEYSYYNKKGYSSSFWFHRTLSQLFCVTHIWELLKNDNYISLKIKKGNKLKIVLIRILLNYLGVYERFRILLGFKPRNN